MLFVCGTKHPLATVLQGAHTSDINSLRWEPSGKLLASCSDDGSVKLWLAAAEKPVHTLTGEAAHIV
jgi:transducin (beta)-like 1